MSTDPALPETAVRAGVFALVFGVLAIWELLAPRRGQQNRRTTRWPSNLGIAGLNILLVRLLFPLTALAWANVVAQRDIGLFNLWSLPPWLAVLLSFLLLDLAIYLQHRLFHWLPIFWRLHRMHHADTSFDVTLGLRFHPLEIIVSLLIKMIAIAALGAPALAVLAFEVALNASSMFNHANVRLPAWLDKSLRLVVVTPDMHRVHHSVHEPETNSNFGFNLPWWDRLFGTYRAQPKDGHQAMQIGLPWFREPGWLRLDRMLVQPWFSPGKRP